LPLFGRRRLAAGELVQVRPLQEILATLTPAGDREGLPFMPEMAQYCGLRFQVFKRVHKSCDLQHGLGGVRTGRLVSLTGVRCDGSAHGGCEASCMALWHEDWLERVAAPLSKAPPAGDDRAAAAPAVFPESWTVKPERGENGAIRYRCQVTEQPAYTKPLGPFEFGQYIEDYLSGNVTAREFIGGTLRTLYRLVLETGVGYRFWVALYNAIQRRRGGLQHPYVQGTLTGTPVERLDLRVGEWVRIRPFTEIMGTLDTKNKNRGLWFVPQEMGEYCGREARVAKRVNRILNERTGEMIEFKTPSVMLDDVYCRGVAIPKRVFCPRASALFWREIWLERIERPGKPGP
jgi:hypothetical protein